MPILFNEIVFGPIHSRRLGVSLGINLLPTHSKLCNFDCIYCECGWNKDAIGKNEFHSRQEVKTALETKLQEMQAKGQTPDSITFAGNGEPTMNPQFGEIIDDTLKLRDKYSPKAKISVLSNATMLGRDSVFQALKKVDNAILKLDSGINTTALVINKPQLSYSIDKIIERMQKFEGKMFLQTMFLRGNYEGTYIDNTTEVELKAWIDAIQKIKPNEIMIYTIDRETPASGLCKVSFEQLDQIGERVQALGYKVQVAKK